MPITSAQGIKINLHNTIILAYRLNEPLDISNRFIRPFRVYILSKSDFKNQYRVKYDGYYSSIIVGYGSNDIKPPDVWVCSGKVLSPRKMLQVLLSWKILQ
jgi:hypothetical protein